MAIAFANVLHGSVQQSGGQTAITTASWTPSGTAQYLLSVSAYDAAINATIPNPSVSGNGIVWTLIAHIQFGASGTIRSAIWMFAASGLNGSPGGTTVSWSTALADKAWVIDAITGADPGLATAILRGANTAPVTGQGFGGTSFANALPNALGAGSASYASLGVTQTSGSIGAQNDNIIGSDTAQTDCFIATADGATQSPGFTFGAQFGTHLYGGITIEIPVPQNQVTQVSDSDASNTAAEASAITASRTVADTFNGFDGGEHAVQQAPYASGTEIGGFTDAAYVLINDTDSGAVDPAAGETATTDVPVFQVADFDGTRRPQNLVSPSDADLGFGSEFQQITISVPSADSAGDNAGASEIGSTAAALADTEIGSFGEIAFSPVFLHFTDSDSGTFQDGKPYVIPPPPNSPAQDPRGLMWQRPDLIYSTQIGAWNENGGVVTTQPSVNAASRLSVLGARMIRWQMWQTPCAIRATSCQTTANFVQGLRTITGLGCIPMIGLPPIYDEQYAIDVKQGGAAGTDPWSLAWQEYMVDQVCQNVDPHGSTWVFEMANEPGNYGQLTGQQYHDQLWNPAGGGVHALKAYARTQGYGEISIGGPGWANTYEPNDLNTLKTWLTACLADYNAAVTAGDPHAIDYLPDFVSTHCYMTATDNASNSAAMSRIISWCQFYDDLQAFILTTFNGITAANGYPYTAMLKICNSEFADTTDHASTINSSSAWTDFYLQAMFAMAAGTAFHDPVSGKTLPLTPSGHARQRLWFSNQFCIDSNNGSQDLISATSPYPPNPLYYSYAKYAGGTASPGGGPAGIFYPTDTDHGSGADSNGSHVP